MQRQEKCIFCRSQSVGSGLVCVRTRESESEERGERSWRSGRFFLDSAFLKNVSFSRHYVYRPLVHVSSKHRVSQRMKTYHVMKMTFSSCCERSIESFTLLYSTSSTIMMKFLRCSIRLNYYILENAWFHCTCFADLFQASEFLEQESVLAVRF